MASPKPSPKPKGTSPELTESQRLSLEDIQAHLDYFSSDQSRLIGHLTEPIDVGAIRTMFDENPPASKKAKKVVTQFNKAFNFTRQPRSNVPKVSKPTAGKSTTNSRHHKLTLIVQRLMDFE